MEVTMIGRLRLLLLLLMAVLLLPMLLAPIACDDDSPADRLAAPVPIEGIIRVPAQQPTIQAGIDAARPGDVVLIADGVYTGPGNRDLDLGGKSIVISSENGPEATIVDCQGRSDDPHFGFRFLDHEDGAVLRGLTIRGAYAAQGAAVYCQSSSPTLIDCVLEGNRATVSGGALRCKSASPRLVNCTLAGNAAPVGGAVFALAAASPRFERCIIAFSSEGEAIRASDGASQPLLSCCNLYGNAGGDWVGSMADQAAIQSNLSADPRFCDRGDGDYTLCTDSPCLAALSPCGVLIGALGRTCAACVP